MYISGRFGFMSRRRNIPCIAALERQSSIQTSLAWLLTVAPQPSNMLATKLYPCHSSGYRFSYFRRRHKVHDRMGLSRRLLGGTIRCWGGCPSLLMASPTRRRRGLDCDEHERFVRRDLDKQLLAKVPFQGAESEGCTNRESGSG